MAVAREPERNFVPAPEGLHPAVCVDEVDLGDVETAWGPRPTVEIRWQLGRMNPETGRRFEVHKRYRLSLHKKSSLRRDLEIWRGQGFTPEQLKGFDLERLIGVPCQVQVQHHRADEETVYANVTAVLPAMPGGPALQPLDYIRQKSRAGGAPAMPTADEVPF
jgi:hypothetical protein